MADFSFVVGSRFKPLTYELIIKPLQEQTELLNQYEDAYAQLQSEVQVLQLRAEAEADSNWALRYNEYLNSLQLSADALYQQGLNPSSRAAINKARVNYALNIVPILQALAKQAELSKISQSAKPELRMQYGQMPTIDDLIANPNLTQVGYSGSQVEESAMQLAALASVRRTSDSFNQFKNYWMRHRSTIGYTQADVNRFLTNAAKVPELNDIVNRVANQFGNFEGLDDNQKLRMAGEIMSGILKGATYKETNQYQLDPIQIEYERLRIQREENERAAALKARNEALLAINPSNIYDVNEFDKQTKEHLKYSKYFDNYGNITQEGIDAYLAGSSVRAEGNLHNMNIPTGDSAFKKYIDSLTGNKSLKELTGKEDLKDQLSALYALQSENLRNTGKFYDGTKKTEFLYPIEGSQQDDWKNAILRAYPTDMTKIPIVEYSSNTGKYKQTNKNITRENLASGDYTIIGTRMSVYGNVVDVVDKQGNSYLIELPAGINPRNEYNRDESLRMATLWLEAMINAYNTGIFVDPDTGLSHRATDAIMAKALERYKDELINAHTFHSQLGVTNKTDYQKFGPLGY